LRLAVGVDGEFGLNDWSFTQPWNIDLVSLAWKHTAGVGGVLGKTRASFGVPPRGTHSWIFGRDRSS
jgi:hypothetical protein